MRDDIGLKNNISNIEELTEEISSLEKTLKEKMIEIIKGEMDWARLKFVNGKSYHNERIEFAVYYFKLNDILEELYSIDKYKVSELISFKHKMERAYADLLWGVVTSINYN